MDFIDQIKQFSKRTLSIKDSLGTEEATKTALIMPFFQMLGYDVFNPTEFAPEYTADVGIKKGEKVDYAIMQDNEPIILIEAKWVGESLNQHDSQLFRYFGTSTAKFGILTNGLIYKFYTDLDAQNKMDLKPFLEIDICDPTESQIAELKKFQKSNFNLQEVLNTASELRYSNTFRKVFAEQLQNPSDDFVRFFSAHAYEGRLTQNILDKFKGILKKSLNMYITEMMNDKIKTALNTNASDSKEDEMDKSSADDNTQLESAPKIITTQEEIEMFALIRGMLKDTVSLDDITMKDTESYLGILYKNNSRKWICRIKIAEARIVLIYPDIDKKEIKVNLNSIYDVADYKSQLVEVVSRFL
ncbi:MAG: type I restriction enzyme HsdR N-terminal domain-containing protein [Oscillospiraceae bacterium]|jgi:hypothetical protein|nr:type I restriction enzyme HsdR N-terminal domain-containing protein [Oscillospiraceae bacterium]